jgi:hypothetical protein
MSNKFDMNVHAKIIVVITMIVMYHACTHRNRLCYFMLYIRVNFGRCNSKLWLQPRMYHTCTDKRGTFSLDQDSI